MVFVQRRGSWVADAVSALLGDNVVSLDAAHHGLRTAGARWPRYAGLPVPEARALKHALAYARRAGRRPRISVAAFLVDVCKIPQKDVARSLIWPASRIGIRTSQRRQMLQVVSRAWFGAGPGKWDIDVHLISKDRTRRSMLWELRLLIVIVLVIFVGLELGRALLGGVP